VDDLIRDVTKAKEGDLEACGQLVQNTQAMVNGVAFAVLRDAALAEDAAQESYLRAFRHLHELSEPAAFMGWLRRIAVTVAMNMRRLRRTTLLRLDDVPEVPILDETESEWSELQRQHLAAALLALTRQERRICDRRYYGHWSVARLAEDAGVDEATFRKRLQRIRDKLRKEIEMTERRLLGSQDSNAALPMKIVELLARPRLIDLPENPVGKVLEILRDVYPEFMDIDLPEVLDFAEARKTVGNDALYLDPRELHHLGDNRILRYDMTLPFLLTVMSTPPHGPARLWCAGKVYRVCQGDSQHLEAFHQAEALWIDEVKSNMRASGRKSWRGAPSQTRS